MINRHIRKKHPAGILAVLALLTGLTMAFLPLLLTPASAQGQDGENGENEEQDEQNEEEEEEGGLGELKEAFCGAFGCNGEARDCITATVRVSGGADLLTAVEIDGSIEITIHCYEGKV